MRHVMGQALRLTAIGGVIGLVGAIALSRVIASMLFGVSPGDPLTFGATLLALFVVVAAASAGPARRAASIEPVVALKGDCNGTNSVVVALRRGRRKPTTNVLEPGVGYFVAYARSTASRKRALRVGTARTLIVRLPTWIVPRGFCRNVRYQPSGLSQYRPDEHAPVHDDDPDANEERCGAVPTRIPRILLWSERGHGIRTGNRRAAHRGYCRRPPTPSVENTSDPLTSDPLDLSRDEDEGGGRLCRAGDRL